MAGHFLSFYTSLVGQLPVNRSALSKPNASRNITSVSQPLERGTMRHHSAKISNREQETKDRRNPPKTRRSAPARVGGSSNVTLWVHAFSRLQRKCPSPLEESRETFSQKGFPGCFPLVLSFAEAKESTPKAERSSRNNITITPKPSAQLNNITIHSKNKKNFFQNLLTNPKTYCIIVLVQ